MSRCQVVSYTPAGGTPRWLGQLGQVSGLTFSSAVPGGYDQMQCTLLKPPDFRSDALVPGRIVKVWCGASCVWDGQMLEPAPSDQGWTVTALGTGSQATEYVALYSGAWSQSGIMDVIVNNAISRGLRWTNPGVTAGNPTGWDLQEVDSGAQFVSDALNLFCSNGGLSWQVGRQSQLSVFTLPTTPNRLLLVKAPVPRTLGGNYTRIYLRYAATADSSGSPATYATAVATDAAGEALFGSPMEDFVDISSAGVMSNSAAVAVGSQILQRYQRATYAGPFAVQQGELMNSGGQPIDLATEMAGTVCKLIMTDFSYGAEEAAGPVTFLVGNYSYDDDSGTATITPFQSLDDDMSNILFEPWVTHTTRADARFARQSTQRAKNRAALIARRKHRHRRYEYNLHHRRHKRG